MGSVDPHREIAAGDRGPAARGERLAGLGQLQRALDAAGLERIMG
jgi:hypothetical protein